MIYAVEEIKSIVLPVAQKYQLRAVYLFGSYARGTATENSDIDRYDRDCSKKLAESGYGVLRLKRGPWKRGRFDHGKFLGAETAAAK